MNKRFIIAIFLFFSLSATLCAKENVKILWREDQYKPEFDSEINTIIVNTDYVAYASDEIKAILAYYSLRGAADCWWDNDKASDEFDNLKCKLTTALDLGHQCSDEQLDFVKHYFRNDLAVKNKHCSNTPYTATIQSTYHYINLDINEDKVTVDYKMSGINSRDNYYGEFTGLDTFQIFPGEVKLISEKKSRVSEDFLYDELRVKDGNIYHLGIVGDEVQLTQGGRDRAPLLSPDESKVVFIRKSEREAYLAVGSEEDYLKSGPDALLADQIWIVDMNSKEERMLVEDFKPGDEGFSEWNGEKVIAHIDDSSLCFSPESDRIYFITSAWVTSGAVHGVDVDGSNHKFITGGNTLEVIKRGRYIGNLIVNKHKYFLACGSYDWYWVMTPEGKEVGPLGPSLDDICWDFLYSKEEK